MNTQEYISSGIVESYVLGLASEEERREFEKMCNQHPEVLAARNAFEIALENQAMQNAIAPSADIKNKIFDTISSSAKIVSIAEAPVKKINWFKYAAVASVILLAGSLLWNVSLMNKNQDLKNNYESSVAKLSELEKDFNVLQQNPNVKMASMKGMEASPKSFATVYWDTTSHDVYLLMNNLPKPASDKQYQLWAFLDGQPIDMGLIEISDKPLQLYQLKKAQAAQAFAITLENKGRPDVSKPEGTVYVLGNL
ncbi:MAG: anti-sigma factor [Chitinophagaceae bacterium]|nr:anti-sigma factor [Chitinophagaceae bacterium]MBP9103126.1 anti-sigma factor [Chitinophagaceae bacterium]